MTFYVKDAEGNVLNTIEASHAFAKKYAELTGYTLEHIPDETETEPIPEPTLDERVASLESENAMLKAKITAQSEQMDFYEDCIAEMAMIVYA